MKKSASILATVQKQ